MVQLSNIYAIILVFSVLISIIMSLLTLIDKIRGYVTPEQLEKAKAEILDIVEKKYPTKEIFSELKEDVKEIKEMLIKLINDGQNT